MSRQVHHIRKDFRGEFKKTWWGFTIPPILCQDCRHDGLPCGTCYDEGKVYPRVELPITENSNNLQLWLADVGDNLRR